jgi:uncharacterized protein YjbI with pentapeptide repeats
LPESNRRAGLEWLLPVLSLDSKPYILEGIDCSGVNFSHTKIVSIFEQRVSFKGANLSGTQFMGCSAPHYLSQLQVGNPSAVAIQDTVFKGPTDWSGANMQKVILRGVLFDGKPSPHLDDFAADDVNKFTNADLTDADFTLTVFSGITSFNGANAKGASFLDALFKGYLLLLGTDLTGTNFRGAFFNGIRVNEETILIKTCFDRATFKGHFDLEGIVTMMKVSFRGAIFEDTVSFMNAKLIYVDFTGATFKEKVSFAGAELKNVDLSGVNLKNASFRGAIIDGLILKDANLENADFSGCDLTKLGSIEKAQLTDVKLIGTTLTLEQAIIFYQQGARDFSGVQIAQTPDSLHLLPEVYKSQILEGAKLSPSLFAALITKGVTNFQGASIQGEGVRFQEVLLHVQDPTRLNFKGTLFNNVDFSDCVLSNVLLGDAQFTDVKLIGTTLTLNQAYTFYKGGWRDFSEVKIAQIHELLPNDYKERVFTGAKLSPSLFLALIQVGYRKFKGTHLEQVPSSLLEKYYMDPNFDFTAVKLPPTSLTLEQFFKLYHERKIRDFSKAQLIETPDPLPESYKQQTLADAILSKSVFLGLIEKGRTDFQAVDLKAIRISVVLYLCWKNADLDFKFARLTDYIYTTNSFLAFIRKNIRNNVLNFPGGFRIANIDFQNPAIKGVLQSVVQIRLADLILEGANLSGHKFDLEVTQAILEAVNLSRTSLIGAKFVQVRFSGVLWAGARLTNAQFRRGTFLKVKFNTNNLQGVCFIDATFYGKTIFEHTDMQRLEFNRARFLSSAEGQNINFLNSEMGKVLFNGVVFEGEVVFDHCLLEGGMFIDSHFRKTAFFEHTDLSGVKFEGVTFASVILANLLAYGVKFKGASFSGELSLVGVRGKEADFSYIVCKSSTDEGLYSVKIISSDLAGGNFEGVRLHQTFIEETNLKGANFKNAVFGENSIFKEVNVADGNFSGCDLSKVVFIEAQGLGTIRIENSILSSQQLFQFYKEGLRDFSSVRLTDRLPEALKQQRLTGAKLSEHAFKHLHDKGFRNFQGTDLTQVPSVVLETAQRQAAYDFTGARLPNDEAGAVLLPERLYAARQGAGAPEPLFGKPPAAPGQSEQGATKYTWPNRNSRKRTPSGESDVPPPRKRKWGEILGDSSSSESTVGFYSLPGACNGGDTDQTTEINNTSSVLRSS